MLDQLKSVMQNGERYIVVEDGRPEYVLMHFADYVALVATGKKNHDSGDSRQSRSRGADLDTANAELEEVVAAERDYKVELAQAPGNPALDPTTIRLEDLPL